MDKILRSFLKVLVLSAFGYMLKQKRILSSETVQKLNRANFYFFIPVFRFISIASTNISDSDSFILLGFAFVCVLVLFGIGCLFFRRSAFSETQKPVLIQALFRSNITPYMIAFILPILPKAYHGGAMMISAFTTSFYNVPSAVVLSGCSRKRSPVCAVVLKNPSIQACLIGIAFLLFSLPLPQGVLGMKSVLQQVITIISFTVIGSGLSICREDLNSKPILLGLFLKLAAAPTIGLVWMHLFQLCMESVLILLPLFCGPCTSNGHTMVKEMGGDEALSGKLVILTQAFAPIGMLIWILFISRFAW